ncbi:outer membrane protein assembly factor BamB [Acidithiobacillus sp. AMEEHan]|uniref:outer membrane protein assembly factor BamB n=1 Tax=Acidithiobacillus sp. AMEEHan TaxID=2994951 RepID=UPI0027E5AB67|nr:outer membrane protein assembly factor BamB [Acidithiobacillus sp. AMEEHan]
MGYVTAGRMRTGLRAIAMLGTIFTLSGCGVWNWAFGPSEPAPKPMAAMQQKISVAFATDWQARLYGEWRLDPYNATQIQVTDHAIYLSDDSGNLLALSRSGRLRWVFHLDGKSPRGPTVAGGVVYVGTDRGTLYAVSAEKGKKLWKVQLGAEPSSPITVADQRLFLQLSNGHLLALGTHNGSVDWTFSLPQPSLLLRRNSGIVISGQTLYTGFADGKLVALSTNDGAELWRATVAIPHGNNELARMVDVAATPVLDGNRVIAAAYQGNIAAFSKDSGEQDWSRPMSTVLTPILHDGRLFVAGSDGQIYAMDPASGTVEWRNTRFKGQSLSGMSLCDGKLLLTNYAGQVITIDPQTGHRTGQETVSSSGIQTAPVCVGKDRFLVLSGVGTLYQLQFTQP